MVFAIIILTNNFENKINSHELNYDPVEYCMDVILSKWGERMTAQAAKACRNANASTKACMKRVIDQDIRKRGNVYGSSAQFKAAEVCIPNK